MANSAPEVSNSTKWLTTGSDVSRWAAARYPVGRQKTWIDDLPSVRWACGPGGIVWTGQAGWHRADRTGWITSSDSSAPYWPHDCSAGEALLPCGPPLVPTLKVVPSRVQFISPPAHHLNQPVGPQLAPYRLCTSARSDENMATTRRSKPDTPGRCRTTLTCPDVSEATMS